MLNIDQIAMKLAVSRNTILSLIKKGEIKAIKVGDQYRIPEESFNKFMSASEVDPTKMVAGSKKI